MLRWRNMALTDTLTPVTSTELALPESRIGSDELPAVLRILVVEDNQDVGDMLHQLLVGWGQKTLLAREGARAIELAREFRPHVVLLDLGLPGLHGYEVARQLRQLPGPRMTIIAVTGWGQEADRQQSKAAGIDYHIVKPAAPDALRPLLESLSLDVESRPD